MAVLTIYNPPVFGGGVGLVTSATDTQITIVSGAVTQNYYGSGFSYSGASVISGTVTDTNLFDANNGGWQYGITGLSHDAVTVASYVNSGNQHGLTYFFLFGNDTLNGSAGSDILNGYMGVNVVFGNGGDDTLHGALGSADSLIGGSGNDFYVLSGPGAATLTELPGEGIDTVQINTSFTLSDHFENLLLGDDGIAMNGTGNALDNLIGGNTYSNLLLGLGGNDTLLGSNGNDTLDGGDGANVLRGGADDDFYFVSSVFDVVEELSGTDTVYVLIDNYVLVEGLENLVLGESLLNGGGNSAANVLTGNGLNNTFSGGGSNDTLDGQGGDDTLAGGDGDDFYFIDSSGDVLLESAGGGVDTVRSQVSLVLGEHFENLQLGGFSAISGTGNALANFLVGNDAGSILNGGAGADTMRGGAGNDTFYVDNPGDSVADFDGFDTVITSFTFDLAGSTDIENVTFTGSGNFNATGNSRRNVIIGNDGNNTFIAFNSFDRLHGAGGNDTLIGAAFEDTLDGGAGIDSMIGGQGDDAYFVDDAGDVIIETGSSLDTVYSSISFVLLAGLEAVVLLGDSQINASGTGSLTGNSAGNHLTGGASYNDSLYGMGGDDTLDGGDGVDMMRGGTGNDFFFVDSVNEVTGFFSLLELADEGNDTIITAENITLPDHVESLYLAEGAWWATGNAAANILSGNSGNNILDGVGGADIIAGGPGDDTYVLDNSGDQVMELGDSGVDNVSSSVSYDLMQAWHVEKLTLTGGSAISGSGNWLDNVITGNSSVNVLHGNRGNDTLNGGHGNDTLIGGLGDDVLVWDAFDGSVQGGAGEDTLWIEGFGLTLNLMVFANSVITDMEVIDLTGIGNNTLTLSASDLLDLSTQGNVLTVNGNFGDSVNLQGAWIIAGGTGYTTYHQGQATILVDTDIAVAFFI